MTARGTTAGGTTAVPARDRAHLDALVLASLAGTERDGHEVMEHLRRRGGAAAGPSRVFATLHRLARNRLVRRSPGDPRRYRLTATGERSLAGRTAAARGFAAALDALQAPG